MQRLGESWAQTTLCWTSLPRGTECNWWGHVQGNFLFGTGGTTVWTAWFRYLRRYKHTCNGCCGAKFMSRETGYILHRSLSLTMPEPGDGVRIGGREAPSCRGHGGRRTCPPMRVSCSRLERLSDFLAGILREDMSGCKPTTRQLWPK